MKYQEIRFLISTLFKKWPVAVLLFAFLFTSTRSALAAPIELDSFTQIPDGLVLNFTSGTQSGTLDHASILGGERDLQATITSGAGTMIVNSSNISGYLSHSTTTGLRGRTFVSWDGNDNDATSINPTGLGGVNLQSPTNDAFILGIVSADLASQISIQVFTDGTNHSTATAISVPASATPQTIIVLFSSFGVTGGTGADFTNVGAVLLTVNSAALPVASLDMEIDFFTAGESTSYRDFGDLPDTYATLLPLGARHVTSSLFLGASFDNESDGNPTGGATGDGADENGVTRIGNWADGVNGGTVNITVTGDATACVSGWIDFSQDGDFGDAGEQVLDLVLVNAGSNNLSFDIPAGTFDGTPPNVVLNARFRLANDVFSDTFCFPQSLGGDEPDLASTGEYMNGEVEDYQWPFTPTAVTLESLSVRNTNNLVAIGVAGVLLLGGALILLRSRKPTAE